MSNFITNSGSKNLTTRLSELIQESDELKFLVGFFYFSGAMELIDSLQKNPDSILKILVGLSVDSSIYGIVEYAESSERTNEERKDMYQNSVLKAINNDEFDKEQFYRQAYYVIEQISAGRIVIRKTLKSNHSKLYLFKLKESQVIRKNLFITGSSNLTKAGLTDQNEFNVEISDYGFTEAEQYFDSLWDSAVHITEDDREKRRLISNLKNKTLLKSVHPFDAYMYVVKTWLDTFYTEEYNTDIAYFLQKKGYRPLKYEIDAVWQGLSIIEEYGGVILADVVGLGKSIIASLIGWKMRKRGIIICPPGLIGDENANSGWKKYKEDFELYDWQVRSGGDLDSIIEFLKRSKNIEVIIVDEAHRFRNGTTETYEKLKTICRGRKVILLTATPFNNTPADILSLLSLFIVPKKSNITLSSNLVDLFRFYNGLFKDLAFITKNWKSKDPSKKDDARRKYNALFCDGDVDMKIVTGRAKLLSQQIREVIEPVIVRRNRLDLQNDPEYKKEIKELSKVEEPKEWYYKLTREQSEFYDRVIEKYFTDNLDYPDRFKGPVYKPYKYEGNIIDEKKLTRQEQIDRLSQDNLYDILRRQMVKRLESSFGAFKQSVENLLNSYIQIKTFIQNSNGRYILDRNLINKADVDDPESIDEILSQFIQNNQDREGRRNKIYDVNKFAFKDLFFADMDSDIALFKKIKEEIDTLKLVENDPKLDTLLSNVGKILKSSHPKNEPPAKVVIFSEYTDTIKHLKSSLNEYFNNRVLVITGGLSASILDDINTNFDAAYPTQYNDYDILLSTDKLSEGFNLNRASTVINYDIPWNPVRVIQRVGRINRISRKVFDKLYIINFFPTEQGADIVRSRQIAEQKMFMIHQTLGEDTRIFDPDEEPSPAKLFSKLQTNPYELEPESLYSKLKNLMHTWQDQYPEKVDALNNMPIRVKTAKSYSSDSLVMCFRKGKLFCVSQDFKDENNHYLPLPFEEVLKRIECQPETEHLPLSNDFWINYNLLKREAEKFSYRQSQLSNSEKAYNFLSFLVGVPDSDIQNWRSFILMLKEDIQIYGTLPEYTLKTIADWDNNGKPNFKHITQELEKLSQALGNDYLNKVKFSLKEYEPQIIVAIENQKWN
ncbi:MAG TPA: helicase-related protein [Candidatus Cloacimonas sp.]|jgi:superfamily II DNA or RNA helicase/HKD family nuclease|nr:helicase-related protein [Candidatus Cloacimonas sp.]HPH72293.1 helicase-related protein [Candidatus Cloacimonas sp.]HPK60095.1 helicase-related protein [Candidatus Cloacimonas sp.]